MADFSDSKQYPTAVYPVHAKETSGLLSRCEAILTPDKLKSRFLKGIPLTFPNGDTFTNEDLKDKILLAMNEVELLIGVTLNREQRMEKHPFDISLYKSYIHFRAEQGPIISVDQLAIVDSEQENIFKIPARWIEASNFAKRQINVIPLLSSYGNHQISGAVTDGGYAYLSILNGLQWSPAYWQITYTTGLSKKEGQLPIPVNELIGIVAAIDVLSNVASSNIYNSQSLSQDGISQSSSGPGPNVYKARIEDLENKKKVLVKKLKAIFFGNFITSNI